MIIITRTRVWLARAGRRLVANHSAAPGFAYVGESYMHEAAAILAHDRCFVGRRTDSFSIFEGSKQLSISAISKYLHAVPVGSPLCLTKMHQSAVLQLKSGSCQIQHNMHATRRARRVHHGLPLHYGTRTDSATSTTY